MMSSPSSFLSFTSLLTTDSPILIAESAPLAAVEIIVPTQGAPRALPTRLPTTLMALFAKSLLAATSIIFFVALYTGLATLLNPGCKTLL